MRKCSSAPQLAGQERQLNLARTGSRGLSAKGGPGGGGAACATSRLGTASCNSLASLGEDDGGSPRKATLPGQSLSSGNLGSLGSGGLGPRHGSGHTASSPRSVRAISGTFGCAGAFSGSGGFGTLSSKGASSSSLSSAAFSGSTLQRGAKALKPPPSATRGPKVAQALLLDTPPVPPPQQQLPFEQLAEEAGEWMMEGASHGIASTDCFELFGFPEDAPNLRDPDSSGADEAKQAQERARRTAEAACLLTPATGQERDMGAQLHAAVRRAAVESEAQTQANYTEEIRRQAAETLLEEQDALDLLTRHKKQTNYAEEIRRQAAESLLEELDATLASPDKASPRRRRRADDEKLDAEVLKIIVDDSAGDEPAASAGDHSPRTRQALAAMFAERQPSRNMLTIDEEDLPLASADVAASIDLPHPCASFPAAEPFSSKDAAPEHGSHPAYQPPLVLVDSATGNHNCSTSVASGAGGGGGLQATGCGNLDGSNGNVTGSGPLSRGGNGIESPFARQSADASLSKRGPGADSDGNPGAPSSGDNPGTPALASMRPRSTSAPLAQAVSSANSAANAAPPAGGGASPGSAHPAVPPQPSAVPTSAPRRTTADKATRTPDDQPLPKQAQQQSADGGGEAGSAGGCGGGAAGGGSKSSFKNGSGRGLGGTKGAEGAVSSNAVPFVRPRSKAASGHDGAAGNI